MFVLKQKKTGNGMLRGRRYFYRNSIKTYVYYKIYCFVMCTSIEKCSRRKKALTQRDSQDERRIWSEVTWYPFLFLLQADYKREKIETRLFLFNSLTMPDHHQSCCKTQLEKPLFLRRTTNVSFVFSE